jgi:hypothetical protein
MEFDKEKWGAYVQEQGGHKNLASTAMENRVIQYCYLYDDALEAFEDDFNPIIHSGDTALFMALKLDIEEFILPEPVQTVTGIEALQALCDGKVLRLNSNSDQRVDYEIHGRHIMRRYVGNKDFEYCYQPREDSGADFFLNHIFEVIPCQ